MKIKLQLNSLSASINPYLMPDGMANLSKIQTLGERAAKYIDPEAGSAQVSGAYYLPKKAKPTNHSTIKADKGDLKYLTQRATKVVLRKRMIDNPSYTLLLPILTKDSSAPASTLEQVKLAVSALNRHATKSESVKTKVSKEKAKIRDANSKVFEASAELLRSALGKGGIKDTSIVTSQGMFGSTLIVKLGPDNYVQIGSSDASKFRAAKKSLAAE